MPQLLPSEGSQFGGKKSGRSIWLAKLLNFSAPKPQVHALKMLGYTSEHLKY